MEFVTASCCLPGCRQSNEDAVFSGSFSAGFLAIVADGLGGHGHGDAASQAVVQSIRHGFMRDGSISPEGIQRLFEDAEDAVRRKQTASCRMKSTTAILLCQGDQAVSAHMGDSRLYYFRDGRLDFCTADHSVPQMAVFAGEISRKDIPSHPDRNRVLRALGSGEVPRPDVTPLPSLGEHDAFLLCTDGFWSLLTDLEMEVDLSKSVNPSQWLGYLLTRVGRRVREDKVNADNLSAIAVFCQADSPVERTLVL